MPKDEVLMMSFSELARMYIYCVHAFLCFGVMDWLLESVVIS